MSKDEVIKTGIIDTSQLFSLPEPHEYEIAKFFAKRGFDIIFIRPSSIKGTHTPDFSMGGKNWEAKTPITYSKSSFEYNFKKATKQSCNIIFDLRKLNTKQAEIYMKELQKRAKSVKVKNLIIITREGSILTYKGDFDIM